MPRGRACIDGNEAAARVAYALSEVVAIYPITPASPMGEHADQWASEGRPNLLGTVPAIVEMQSEAGAAGALHGAALEGALATTFTSSQGLLLMLPNMYKLAGELTPAVIHVAARAIATHALSIFGDHSDVMAARTTGWALLSSSSVQEAHDLALVAHAASLEARLPFLHFFDGFRTSHELNTIELLDDDVLRAVVDDTAIADLRARRLRPERPVLRGSSQNPDVFFQGREAANPVYRSTPAIVQDVMDRLAALVGRQYHLVEYAGAPDAERVLVLMGSAAGAARETVDELVARGERVGVVTLHLYRPFPAQALLAALPPTVRAIAVLDRTKEAGSIGGPLYLDVLAALAERPGAGALPRVVGARYGLGSKEVTPAMLKGLLDELEAPCGRHHVTVGIDDDVSGTTTAPDASFRTDGAEVRAVFFGLGSDGTVGSTKATTKILHERTGRFVQAYSVYDSKKAGTLTVSHLRASAQPIRSTYLIDDADFVSCSQWSFLDRVDVVGPAARGATVLLNAPVPAGEVWESLPPHVQRIVRDRELQVWAIDADAIAREEGLGRRSNTVLQTAHLLLTGLLPESEAVDAVLDSVEHEYGKRGREVVEQNRAAVRRTAAALHRVEPTAPETTVVGATGATPAVAPIGSLVGADAPAFVRDVTAALLASDGDRLPVSALPADGTFPTGTARWEKRSLARQIPIWDPDLCIDCGKCAIVCPHAAIRMKAYEPAALEGAPDGFPTKPFRSRELPGLQLTVQVLPDDCTGCGVCVEVCPAHAKDDPARLALALEDVQLHRDRERERAEYFLDLPELDRASFSPASVKTSQLLEPLFEFSGACAGCGETPYLKLLSQLFGNRAIVANATGCSSIYGGNLPTTPWTVDAEGRGPAWANSLFEDNAEFGLGIRVATDQHAAHARSLVERLAPVIGDELATGLLTADQADEGGVAAQRHRIAELRRRLVSADDLGPDDAAAAIRLLDVADDLVRRSVWLVGGDGWAYDIDAGGLDHVLASGRDVNVLVLDTEVYSNTGGQASKATPRGAVARFAAGGKTSAKKDLALLAAGYGDVYVAQIALGGNEVQAVKALLEADAWPGPSLVIAYSSCVTAHGFAESQSMAQQRTAVRSGYWPLLRYHPDRDEPFELDSHPKEVCARQLAATEARFTTLARTDPDRSDALLDAAQADLERRWARYEQLVAVRSHRPAADDATP